ncbi:hypothetical protein HK098_004077 [Nowakowskiella sp. JEL0407]|nr:hypothetical protein HK098_004077 [Nowakowskiella sp. JEL0407]
MSQTDGEKVVAKENENELTKYLYSNNDSIPIATTKTQNSAELENVRDGESVSFTPNDLDHSIERNESLAHDNSVRHNQNTSSADTLASFHNAANTIMSASILDPDKRDLGKLFVGALNWDTTDESLCNYFSQYGEVLECVVMKDANSGRSRGFGFLTFKDADVVDKVVSMTHYLDGKMIDPKRAVPREEQERTEKIFVGGLPTDSTEESLREYFEQFGTVIDATLMISRETGRPRGFGFITFESSQGVEDAFAAQSRGSLKINNKTVEIRRALPKSKTTAALVFNNGVVNAVGTLTIPGSIPVNVPIQMSPVGNGYMDMMFANGSFPPNPMLTASGKMSNPRHAVNHAHPYKRKNNPIHNLGSDSMKGPSRLRQVSNDSMDSGSMRFMSSPTSPSTASTPTTPVLDHTYVKRNLTPKRDYGHGLNKQVNTSTYSPGRGAELSYGYTDMSGAGYHRNWNSNIPNDIYRPNYPVPPIVHPNPNVMGTVNYGQHYPPSYYQG